MAQIDIKQIRGASQGSILFLGTQSIVRESSNLTFDFNTNKFTLSGTLSYVDGNQNEGYVLVSDSQGNASWTENIKFGNGLSQIGITAGIGGTLSYDTTISSEGFDFTIDNFDLLTMTGSSIDVQLTDGYFLLDVTSGSVDVYAQQILVLATDSLDLSAVQFAIDTDSASITTNNNEGLVYTQDYSGTFVTNSLVTKKYVDSLNFNVGTENGLTSNGGLIGIGGTLSRNTTISAEGFDFQIEDFDTFSLTGSLIDIYLEDGDFILDTGNNGNIDLYSGQTTIWGINTLDLLTSQFSLDSTTASITTLSLEGLVYTQDYSGTFVTNSLVSKKYADSLVKPENGLTSNNGFIGLGGTLSRNTNISAENFNFTLDNFDVLSLTGSSLDIQLFDGYFILDAHSGTVDIYGQQMLLYATSSIDIATTQFTISSESGTITTNNLEGLVYTQDYSGTFVTNSLVSKKYVDSQITFSGATNGISKIGDFLGLGGTISQDTKFKVENFDVSFEGFDTFGLTGSIIDIQLYEGDFFLDTGTSGSVNVYSEDIINYASVNLSIISDDIFTITTNNSLVTTLNGEGLVYSQDYSGSFVTNSLVSKNYVDNLISATNGLTFLNNTITLGGNLSANTTIQTAGYDFTIEDFDTLVLTGSSVDIQIPEGSFILDTDDSGTVDIWSGNILFYADDSIDVDVNNEFVINSGTFSVTTTNNLGIVYTNDYSATFVTHSLVTKKYVDDQIGSIGGNTQSLNTSLISSIGTGTNTIYSFATASYSGAFIDYTLTNESNARAGNISAIWLGTEIKFVEVSTMDIGTTAGLTFSFIISGTYAVLQAESSSNWQLKTIIRSI